MSPGAPAICQQLPPLTEQLRRCTCKRLQAFCTAVPHAFWQPVLTGTLPPPHPIFCSSSGPLAYLQQQQRLVAALKASDAKLWPERRFDSPLGYNIELSPCGEWTAAVRRSGLVLESTSGAWATARLALPPR